MKILITILFCIFNLVYSYSQTSLDSLLFQKINEYRLSKGLDILIWDNNVYKMSNHHSTYLSLFTDSIIKIKGEKTKTGIFGHSENKKIDGIEQLPNVMDRINKFISTKINKKITGGENCLLTSYYKYENVDDIINKFITLWKGSKLHNDFLLNKEIKYGACSVVEKNIILNYEDRIVHTYYKYIWITFNGIYYY